jgi:NAD dependent epimerase/dehydratase family enzyme
MADFSRNLGAVVGGRLSLPVPGFLIEQIFGDGATVILDGQRVLSKRLADTGFTFEHTDLRAALASII